MGTYGVGSATASEGPHVAGRWIAQTQLSARRRHRWSLAAAMDQKLRKIFLFPCNYADHQAQQQQTRQAKHLASHDRSCCTCRQHHECSDSCCSIRSICGGARSESRRCMCMVAHRRFQGTILASRAHACTVASHDPWQSNRTVIHTVPMFLIVLSLIVYVICGIDFFSIFSKFESIHLLSLFECPDFRTRNPLYISALVPKSVVSVHSYIIKYQ